MIIYIITRYKFIKSVSKVSNPYSLIHRARAGLKQEPHPGYSVSPIQLCLQAHGKKNMSRQRKQSNVRRKAQCSVDSTRHDERRMSDREATRYDKYIVVFA